MYNYNYNTLPCLTFTIYIFIYRPFISVHKRDIAFTSVSHKGWYMYHGTLPPLVLLPHHLIKSLF